jgi:membrane-bound serine protease (ClpP class)
MDQKDGGRSVRGYTIYAIGGTVIELLLLLAVIFGLLPLFGINLPPWIIAILLSVLLGVSYFTYHMGRRALRKKMISGLEAIIGSEGTVMESFNRTGYVKVGNELWKAETSQPVEKGDIVVVKAVKGLKIEVAPESVAGRKRTEGQPDVSNLF